MVRKAEIIDLSTLVALGLSLWPENTREELAADFSETLKKKDTAFFLAFTQDTAMGFAQCQLRRDYVEGTESSPAGYLEGIFVAEEYRRQGVARELLDACEAWAADLGCREFASDCELDNAESLRFHLNAGFREANRIICFTKKL